MCEQTKFPFDHYTQGWPDHSAKGECPLHTTAYSSGIQLGLRGNWLSNEPEWNSSKLPSTIRRPTIQPECRPTLWPQSQSRICVEIVISRRPKHSCSKSMAQLHSLRRESVELPRSSLCPVCQQTGDYHSINNIETASRITMELGPSVAAAKALQRSRSVPERQQAGSRPRESQ